MGSTAVRQPRTTGTLLDRVDLIRLEAGRRIDEGRRSDLGQFMTPPSIAEFMAALFERMKGDIKLLDAGAGTGMLTSAVVARACLGPDRPRLLNASAYEIDPALCVSLESAISACAAEAASCGVRFDAEVVRDDFIRCAVEEIDSGLFASSLRMQFTHAILNPPYKKLNSDSEARLRLRRAGIETSNLYAAFLALAVQLLEVGGELVAITPRSFCNGPYFRPFRELFFGAMNLRRIHIFDSRSASFSDDQVLQENVILHAIKGPQAGTVVVSSSNGPADEDVVTREVPFDRIVRPGDPERFIHVVPDELGQQVADALASLKCALPELGLSVSTGRVVDFRAERFLRKEPGPNTVPLIYPGHLRDGSVSWPRPSKKPNALVDCPETAELLVPSGTYVLVKRFSSKEEKRRVVATVFDPQRIVASKVGFENHLNVYHVRGGGLDAEIARGVAAFLNSTLVDVYFRQFNGHTQVNATDLRSLRYPHLEMLRSLGRRLPGPGIDQDTVDALVEEIVMGADGSQRPLRALKKIEQALEVLKALDVPREQQNERSALTLLSLLDLGPETPWSAATAPLMGITPMMSFFSEKYGKTYAPNTRETVRRQTVHQFVQAGLLVLNPDKPDRPVNSPKAVYQIEESALELLRTFGGAGWESALATYLKTVETLKAKYERAREMQRIAVKLPEGQKMTLSPGGQNDLIKLIVEEFCPRFAPGGHVIYVGDTEEKWAIFDDAGLARLGVKVDSHGKMPDVVIHHQKKKWLLLIEAVTSHGPVGPKRRLELARLFKGSKAGLVYVTAFLSRKAMVKYLGDISWETEVWVADAPDHLIHFDGERFLGPYEE